MTPVLDMSDLQLFSFSLLCATAVTIVLLCNVIETFKCVHVIGKTYAVFALFDTHSTIGHVSRHLFDVKDAFP